MHNILLLKQLLDNAYKEADLECKSMVNHIKDELIEKYNLKIDDNDNLILENLLVYFSIYNAQITINFRDATAIMFVYDIVTEKLTTYDYMIDDIVVNIQQIDIHGFKNKIINGFDEIKSIIKTERSNQ